MTCSDTVSPMMSMMCSSPEFSLTTSSDVSLQLRHVNPNLQRYESNQKNRSTQHACWYQSWCYLFSPRVVYLEECHYCHLLLLLPLLPLHLLVFLLYPPWDNRACYEQWQMSFHVAMYAVFKYRRNRTFEGQGKKNQSGWNLKLNIFA